MKKNYIAGLKNRFIINIFFTEEGMRKAGCLVLCMVLLSGFVFAGGGGQKSGGAGKPVIVKVWTNDAHNKQERDANVAEFNKGEGAQRGIEIEYTVYGTDYYTALDLALAAGEEPHLYKDTKTSQRVQQGLTLPLTEFPDWYKTEVIDRYRPYMAEGDHLFDGVVYSIPWGGSSYAAMAYNVPLLKSVGIDSAPKSWAEFEAACIAIARANPGKKYGTYVPLKYTNFHLYYTEPVLIPTYGHSWFNFDTGRYTFTEFVDFFEMYQRLNAAGALFPGMESLDDDTARAQFSEGNIGFELENPSFNIGVFYDQFPAKEEWKVAPIVTRDPGKAYRATSGTGLSLLVSKRAKAEGILEQVARVHALWVSDKMLMDLFTGGKDLPKLPDIIAKAKPSLRPQWNDTAALTVGAPTRPAFPDSQFVVEGDTIYTAFSKIFLGGDARTILADLEKRYNDAFDRAIARGTLTREYYIRPEFQKSLIK
jgi:ABC-type glycerol-3-phosphate transport system substrate-binding protein